MIFLLILQNEKLIILFNSIKHDKFFKPPTDGDGWSTYPNEHFFVKRFEGTSISGKELRYLERDIFSRRFSSDNPAYHHHIRDYHTLCRGGKLVRSISNNQHLSTISTCKYIPNQSVYFCHVHYKHG